MSRPAGEAAPPPTETALAPGLHPPQTSGDGPEPAPPNWEELVRQHSDQVYRLAYRLTGNGSDAEDLTQDVFIRVFRTLHNFRPGTFKGWLHRVTTNLFIDSARRKQRIRFDGLSETADERLPSALPAPSQCLDEAGLEHDVAAALASLAPELRAAIVLYDIEGLSYQEVADTLGAKIGTVRSRIHRARSQLRAALAHRRPSGRHRRYFGIDAESGHIPRPGSMPAFSPA